MLNHSLYYEKSYLLAFGLITSCQSPDEISEPSSNLENYNARTSTSSLLTLEEAKSIALRQRPIGLDPVQLDPCSGVQFPIFTPTQVDRVITILDKNSNPAMYLFNADTSGFLLLSASKLEEPILAYSTEAPFEMEDMPRDLAIWLDLGITKISQLNKMNYYYDLSVYDSWNALGINSLASNYFIGDRNGIPIFIDWPTFTRENVGCPEYETTGPLLREIMWGQREGYNNYQNEDLTCGDSLPDNKLYYAGCVMVAFGQIMKYHNDFGDYPVNPNDVEKRVGSDIIGDGHEISSILRSLYDLTPGTKWRRCSGTAAHIYETARVLRGGFGVPNIFKYSSAKYVNHFNSIQAWDNIVNKHLPIVLAGYGVEKEGKNIITIRYMKENRLLTSGIEIGEGHAWVCDGFKEEYQKVKVTNNTTNEVTYERDLKREFWHMNWGWHIADNDYAPRNGWYRDGLFKPKGENNGNKLIDYNDIIGYDLNGDGVSDGAFHDGYYYDRSMVINIP